MSRLLSNGLKALLLLGLISLVTNCAPYQPPGGGLYRIVR